MQTTKPRTKLALDDEERSSIRWFNGKVGHIVVLDFHNGPRGGRYRSTRSRPVPTETDALREMDKLVNRRWRVPIKSVHIYQVDHLGNVLSDEDMT